MLAAAEEEGVEVYPERGWAHPLIGEIALCGAVGGWPTCCFPDESRRTPGMIELTHTPEGSCFAKVENHEDCKKNAMVLSLHTRHRVDGRDGPIDVRSGRKSAADG